MGATQLMLFIVLAIISSSFATQHESCASGDLEICSTIITNQVTLSDVKNGMEELAQNLTSQLLENSKEIKDLITIINSTEWEEDTQEKTTQREELKICRSQIDDEKSKIVILQKKNLEAYQRNTSRENEKSKLRQEVQDLKQSKEDMEENIRHLGVQIPYQVEQIANLTWMAHLPMDCADRQLQGETESGVYTIYPYQNEIKVKVQCDFDSNGGGWTVFFTRMPQDIQLDFNALWENFKKGFGNVNTEYWMGNDFLHALTSYNRSTLRFDAENFDGVRRWAEWNTFHVANEDNKYQLTVEDFQSTSTMGDSLSMNNKCKFTTTDKDNDEYKGVNCAMGSRYTIVGPGAWWYKRCGYARPTGPLINTNDWLSACWLHWNPKGRKLISFKILSVKLRRHNYAEFAHVNA